MSLRSILPSTVAVVETTNVDRVVDVHDGEREFVARAVKARRNEFALGRMLAHDALSMIGAEDGPIPVGDHREPVWPSGAVGSITHCPGYTAAVAARSVNARSVGIDVEPKLPLPDGVHKMVLSADESAATAPLGTFGDRLIFSAKESIYKAWFPLTGRWLGFHDCYVTMSVIDDSRGSFVGEIATEALSCDSDLARFHGRYVIGSRHLMTAVFVPALG